MRVWLVVALVGCGRGGRAPETPVPAEVPPPVAPVPAPPPARTLRFDPVGPGPDLATTKAPHVTTRAVLDGTEVPVGFHLLFRGNDDGRGTIHALGGKALDTPCTEADSQSLLEANGRPWLVSHFECPAGAVWLTELSKDPQGLLAPVAHRPVSFDAWGGMWNPCAGMVSPWGTHIGSEEYEPDARAWKPEAGTLEPDDFEAWKDMMRTHADPRKATPYRYGWATEIGVGADGAPTAAKHPALGRFSHELSYVLPDARTVYQSDDGADTGFFLFVADRANDLSAGKLYAAALRQESDAGAFAVTWVPLGHATDAEITALVEARVTLDDLFEVRDPGSAGTCPDGFGYARHMYGRECLKLRPASAKVPDPARAASRLETRRYAALLGATMELEKAEGVAYDAETGRVFLALSSQKGPMVAEPDEPVDAIKMTPNACGTVFAADTAAGVSDRAGEPIDSAHAATTLRPEIAGIPLAAPDAAGNRCDPAGISNPDNLTFLSGYGLLMVAEDTRQHANAALWSFDVRSRELVPVLLAPRAGEVTGIQWIPDLLGHGYLTVVVQHPWNVERPPAGVTPDDQRAFVGYLGPFPSLRPAGG